MLKNTLFKITSLNQQKESIAAILEINKDSEIFRGHFPGQPVLPGACMLQIVKEVLEGALKSPVQLKKADQVKFLAIIDPHINNLLQLKFTYNSTDNKHFDVIAGITSQDTVCFKFKGLFITK